MDIQLKHETKGTGTRPQHPVSRCKALRKLTVRKSCENSANPPKKQCESIQNFSKNSVNSTKKGSVNATMKL